LLVVISAARFLKRSHAYSARVVLKMILNVLFDFLVGLIPIIGDICDALHKSNIHNYALLEKHLRVTLEKEMIKLKETATEAAMDVVKNAIDKGIEVC